jgi:hypothetical protein
MRKQKLNKYKVFNVLQGHILIDHYIKSMKCRILISLNSMRTVFLSHFPYFEKKKVKVSLWDHYSVCVTADLCYQFWMP